MVEVDISVLELEFSPRTIKLHFCLNWSYQATEIEAGSSYICLFYIQGNELKLMKGICHGIEVPSIFHQMGAEIKIAQDRKQVENEEKE